MSTEVILRVGTASRESAVAGAIAGIIREGNKPVIHVVGAEAADQAVKAMIIARQDLQEDGIDLAFVPSFTGPRPEQEYASAITFEITALAASG